MRRLGVAMAFCGAVFVGLHELGRRWGATRDEVRGPMAGDDIIPRAKGQTTHAITIDAAVERVWPWLVQMGYHRAGWYTYLWVDRYLWRIDNPSAAQLIPELQDLSVGDIVPDGGLGRASRAGAALNVARPSAAARKDDRRLDVGIRAPGDRRDDDPAHSPGAGDISAVVGPLDLRRHDRAERLHHGEEHAAWHRTPGRGTAVSR